MRDARPQRDDPRRLPLVGIALAALAAVPAAQQAARAPRPQAAGAAQTAPRVGDFRAGALFERVVDVLARRYVERDFRSEVLPELAARFRPAARAARDLAEEQAVVHGMLARVPASHLALYSKATYRHLMAELQGRARPTVGFDLVQVQGRFFVSRVLEGGPAATAGLQRGDEVVALDGVAVPASPRLDLRSDDAALPDLPRHDVLVDASDDAVRVALAGGREVVVAVASYSALQAAAASRRVVETAGMRVGVMHLHYVHHRGAVELLREAFAGPFEGVDAFVLDLRGRGGSLQAAVALQALLVGSRPVFAGPLVVLVDRETRSAKEILAHGLARSDRVTIVGEQTAGAVLPASFVPVDDEHVLMLPTWALPVSAELEGVGVVPDVAVAVAPVPPRGDAILDSGLAAAVVRVQALREPGRRAASPPPRARRRR